MSFRNRDWEDSTRTLPEHLRERLRVYSPGSTEHTGGFVLCWLHHSFRADENPALDTACELAVRMDVPLLIYQAVCEHYRYASDRHHWFMLEGARDLQAQMAKTELRYVFHLARPGNREPHLRDLTRQAAVLVTEDFPLDPTSSWTERLQSTCSTPILLVDSACIVPMQVVGKAYDRAYAYRDATAYEYTKRLNRPWPKCTAKPKPYTGDLPFEPFDLQHANLAEIVASCQIDHAIGPVGDTRGGSQAGYERWEAFKKQGLAQYAKRRNDASIRGVSRLSAYLHYGMISPFRIAREASDAGAEKFLDELLIWRELAYCFCRYRDSVETIDAIPAWAQRTLRERQEDIRDCIHSWEVSARGQTGDVLWDHCQKSLLRHGELHNNVRMTWGKEILQWTRGPEEALARMQDLNHRYALDGRNPSSYGGILWCLGQFDRPFTPPERILGTVRPRPTSEHLRRIDLQSFGSLVNRPVYNVQPKIAMIGAGLGGLMCGRTLVDHGLQVTLFDKSRGVGGRVAYRRSDDGWSCDHGAQYFTVRDRRLAKYAASWVEDGIIAPWEGRVVELNHGCVIAEKNDQQRWVGTPSMNALGKHLTSELDIRQQMEIHSVSRGGDGKYELEAKTGERFAGFDIVLYNLPSPQITPLLPDACRWKERLSAVEFSPCWAVILVLDDRLDVPFDAAFINHGPLRWIARDSSKPDRPKGWDTWVLHASGEWSQENLETAKDSVIEILTDAFRQACGSSLPKLADVAAHRWKYAQPVRCLPEYSMWDGNLLLGGCGDWCNGPRVEGALLSGMSLAGRVLGHLHQSQPHRPQAATGQLSLPF
jgi:photolyase PhrII